MSAALDDLDQTAREPPPGGSGALVYACCRITVTAGPDRGVVIDSDRPLIRIGSAGDNDLVLHDRAVSRHHLEIALSKKLSEYAIDDLSSTNGTYIGALRVEKAALRGRTVLTLGGTTLLFEPRTTKVEVEPSPVDRCGDLVGGSVRMRELYTLIEKVAPTTLPVLVTGETGTGKELTARALHELSARRRGPMVTFDCSTVPATLIESALFGHEKGAFTGAEKSYAGVFERAHGGTLFLDEIGELPIDLQPKLLRVLERGEIERIHGEGPIRVDVRIVAATNRHLGTMSRDGRFRSDLYYRLAVVSLELPPLRERREDIAAIAEEFFTKNRAQHERLGLPARRLSARALERLQQHAFPGNVRELLHTLERTAVFARGEEITATEIQIDRPVAALKDPLEEKVMELNTPMLIRGRAFKEAKAELVDHFERQYLVDLIARHRGNLSRAAREAGLARRHLLRLVEKYEIARV